MLELVELVDGFEGREIGYIDGQDFFNHRLGWIEQGQLLGRGTRGAAAFPGSGLARAGGFQIAQDLPGTANYRRREAGEAGDVDSVTPVGAARNDAVEEHHVVAFFRPQRR